MAAELMNTLVGNVEDVFQLSEMERRLLTEIEPQRLRFEKNSVVFREEDPAHYFLLVKEGICFNHRHLENGNRQIMDLYFPGEVIALGELSRTSHMSSLTTFSNVVILAYQKAEIKEKFFRTARLSRLFVELISREQAILTERLIGVSRHSAKQRVASFLLEVNQRSARAGNAMHRPGVTVLPSASARYAAQRNLVEIPQVLIADVLGLSIVHVNRVLRQFREAGCVRIGSQGIELLELDTLKLAAGQVLSERRAGVFDDSEKLGKAHS